jgi:hypothetical protein
VGKAVGLLVGKCVGKAVGLLVGKCVGKVVGLCVGRLVGCEVVGLLVVGLRGDPFNLDVLKESLDMFSFHLMP